MFSEKEATVAEINEKFVLYRKSTLGSFRGQSCGETKVGNFKLLSIIEEKAPDLH